MDKLFIYGSLAPGECNHHVLKNIPGEWQQASTKGNLFKSGWIPGFDYPGLVPADEGDVVQGVLFSSWALKDYWHVLDEFEGSNYQRKKIRVRLDSGGEDSSYVYAIREGIIPKE